ncbi:hypothetical protein C8F01DRAFT_1135263 [Mycena amicta]|nr:hypothetical protein C8F01DRAFT_1135263 [Mycena amicta]
MAAQLRLTLRDYVDIELAPGDAQYEFLDALRHNLLETEVGERIITSMAVFANEGGWLAVFLKYLRTHFPHFIQTQLPPGVYGRTQCTVGWMAKAVDEKKTETLVVLLSSTIFDTWMESPRQLKPHILGAILTIIVLHEIVHVIQRVFCTTLTLEKLTGSRPPTSNVPMINSEQLVRVKRGEGGWHWEQNVLGEMQVAFEAGRTGEWTHVLAIGFTHGHKTQWVRNDETEFIHDVINLQLFTLKKKFAYKTESADPPPFENAGGVWRHGGDAPLPAAASPTVSPSPSRGLLVFPYTRLPNAEAKRRLEEELGVKVEIQVPVCGTGFDGIFDKDSIFELSC